MLFPAPWSVRFPLLAFLPRRSCSLLLMRFHRRLKSTILETISEKMEQVTNQALSLPPLERTKLIDCLDESLRTDEERAVERAWAEQSERRINAYGRGDTGSISYQDMKRELPPRDG